MGHNSTFDIQRICVVDEVVGSICAMQSKINTVRFHLNEFLDACEKLLPK